MIALLLTSRPVQLLVLSAVIGAVGAYIAYDLKQAGREAERQDIITHNREAGDAGENARLSRSDCIARGLRWNFETARCERGS